MVLRYIRDAIDVTAKTTSELWTWFLTGTKGEYGSKKGSGGGTDINKPGRTLHKRKTK